jgi:Helix-turn-helix domain
VQIPQGAYSSNLTDYQFRLLAFMCLNSGSDGRLQASVAELGSQTGKSSDRTVRDALKALEAKGFFTVVNTRRANGYKGKNIYQLTVDYPSGVSQLTVDYPSSPDKVIISSDSNITDIQLVPSSNTTNSNKLKYSESEIRREILIPMKGYDDGEDLAGYGLVEDRDAPQPKIRKNDPRTRGKRPEHEWTAMDVAAEFSYRVGRKFPLLPGTVNVKQLSGALAKFRTQYQTTPLLELELLRLFMADERNFTDVGDEAPYLYKRFLASFRTKMNQARENLGLSRIASKEFDESPKISASVLTASDGRTFQNTMSGRAQMKRHEERLKGATR